MTGVNVYVRLCALLAAAVSLAALPGIARAASEDLVVMLHATERDGGACAAGIIVREDPDRIVIVTARHNLYVKESDERERERSLAAEFRQSRGRRFPATPIARMEDPDLDLAVLEVRRTSVLAPVPADAFAVYSADEGNGTVTAIGQPGCESWGRAQGNGGVGGGNALGIAFEALGIKQGHSGGGLFAADGGLLGMVYETDGVQGSARSTGVVAAQLQKWGIEPQWRSVGDIRANLIRRAIAPPYLDTAHLRSANILEISATGPSWSGVEGVDVDESALGGKLYVYARMPDGKVYLLSADAADGDEFRLTAAPAEISYCGIVAVPGMADTWAYRTHSFRGKSDSGWITYRDFADPGSPSFTGNSRHCVRPALALAVMPRPLVNIDEKDLPFPLQQAFNVLAGPQSITILFSPAKSGMDEIVTGIRAGVYVHGPRGWRRVGLFAEPFVYDNAFDNQMRRMSASEALAGDGLAICSFNTRGKETFAALDKFRTRVRSDGKLERSAATIFRPVSAASPCEDILNANPTP